MLRFEYENQMYAVWFQHTRTTPSPAPFVTVDVKNCARCEGEHTGMVFNRFKGGPGREGYTHWAMCSKNLEPIYLRVEWPKMDWTTSATIAMVIGKDTETGRDNLFIISTAFVNRYYKDAPSKHMGRKRALSLAITNTRLMAKEGINKKLSKKIWLEYYHKIKDGQQIYEAILNDSSS